MVTNIAKTDLMIAVIHSTRKPAPNGTVGTMRLKPRSNFMWGKDRDGENGDFYFSSSGLQNGTNQTEDSDQRH